MNYPFTQYGKDALNDNINKEFQSATRQQPILHWSAGNGETMAAYQKNRGVQALSQMKNMPRVDSWRVVERFNISGATEHGICQQLIYNQHQPSSTQRPWTAPQKLNFCKAIIKDAIAYCDSNPNCCGYAFAGDANIVTQDGWCSEHHDAGGIKSVRR